MHTEVRFDNFLSGGFTNMAVINPPERKLAKRTSVQCMLFCARKVLNENMYILIGFSIMKITHRYVYMLVHIVHITIHNSQQTNDNLFEHKNLNITARTLMEF